MLVRGSPAALSRVFFRCARLTVALVVNALLLKIPFRALIVFVFDSKGYCNLMKLCAEDRTLSKTYTT